MENLDLDIGNYTIKDIERFFQLKPNSEYTASDIEYKEYSIREQLLTSGHINKRFKRDLIEFLTVAKEWLILVKCKKTAPTVVPKNYKLDKLDVPLSKEIIPRTDEIINRPDTNFTHVSTGDFFPGVMNPLKTRIITKCLTIDSRFREEYYSTVCSDYTFQIPDKLHKVVSMQLASFELPITWYGISSDYGNNYIFIAVEYTPIPNDTNAGSITIDPATNTAQIAAKFTIPSGNYNSIDFINTINNVISPKIPAISTATVNIPSDINNIFSYIQFGLDISTTGSGTGKVTLRTVGTLATFGTTYASNIKSITLDFSLDENGEPSNTDITSRMGWNLGYNRPIYSGKTSYVAEMIAEPATTRYIYLVIDDYTNACHSNYLSTFTKSVLSSNILARVSVRGSYFSLLMDNDHAVISEPRRYFGPVDIQRMRIRLIDEYGRTLNMNNANFSFSIILKMLYDL